MLLQVFSLFCKLSVVQPFRGSGCNASFNSLHPSHQSPRLPTLALQQINPHNTRIRTQSCLWACSANRIRESIHIKNNPSGLQRTVWDWRVCRASRKQGIAMSWSPAGNLARSNLPSITLGLGGSVRDTSHLCWVAAHCFSPMMTLAPSAVPCFLWWPPPSTFHNAWGRGYCREVLQGFNNHE